MIFIGHLPNLRACQAFCDYLRANQVAVESRSSESGGFDIFVASEHEAYAQQSFSRFLADPNQEEFLQASWLVGNPTQGEIGNLGLAKIWHSVGPVTRWIAALCVAIFVFAYFGFARELFFALKFEWRLTEAYRLITPAFMHLSALHLVYNLAFWWFMAARVESALSAQTLIAILIISALTSNFAQAVLVSTQFAGLSGVNYALAGFVWTCGVKYKSNDLYLPNGLFGFLIVWMLLGFADWLPISMANYAHLVGLLTGVGLAFVLVKAKSQRNQTS